MAEAGKDIAWIVTLFLLGAIGVLIIMNAGNFSVVAGSIFSGFQGWGQLLTGSGYQGKQRVKAKGVR